jgi:hypothetical protein
MVTTRFDERRVVMGRRVSVLSLSLAALSWALGAGVLAQDAAGRSPVTVEVPPDGVVQELELGDGSRLFGRVESTDGEQVVFRTVSGVRLELNRAEIRSLRVQDRRGRGDPQPADPNRTRLFFGPTARALPRGRGYLGVYELVVPFVQVGVTDRVTVGGGTPLVFGDGGDSRPFWLTPKVQLVRGDRTQVAAGVMHFVFTGDEDAVGIAYGVVTHGTSDASVTAGFGYGYASSERGSWIGMVGGDKRVGRGVKLLAEGYVWQEGEGILMGGVRLFGSRLSADLGLATFLGGNDSFVFPIVNVVWTF